MTTYQYIRSETAFGHDVDVAVLSKAVEVALPGKVFSVSANGADLAISFDEGLSSEEASALDALVASHKTTVALAAAKALKTSMIDQRTAELAVSGYGHNGRVFSSSEVAQKNLEVLDRNRAGLSYPFLHATKDNSEIYSVADANELHAMYLVGLQTVLGYYQSGNALKQQVINATTIAEVAGVLDTR